MGKLSPPVSVSTATSRAAIARSRPQASRRVLINSQQCTHPRSRNDRAFTHGKVECTLHEAQA